MTDLPDNAPLYRQAGVDLNEGRRFVELIAAAVKKTHGVEVLSEQGGFAGLFDVSFLRDLEQPLLVSGTDGVGTKLRVAELFGRHEGVGIDLVAMCSNDVLVTGARPLFFLDYISCGRLQAEKMHTIVESICEGCRRSGAALLGGETAEHPGVMPAEDLDLAGFLVGVVDRPRLINGSSIRPGDAIIGIPSSGVHSNGFSLIRRLFLKEGLHRPDSSDDCDFLAHDVLQPTVIYEKALRPLLERRRPIHGLAHITGGGFPENIPRILPTGTRALLYNEALPEPDVFRRIRERGNVSREEMFSVFNMGIGMVAVCPHEESASIVAELKSTLGTLPDRLLGDVRIIGEIIAGNPDVDFR